MKIAIVGAGIIGVTTAWELAADGHEVTVFERRGAAAEETSFANAGVVAPGYVTPWAAPGMRGQGRCAPCSRRHGAGQAALAAVARATCAGCARWQRACTLEAYLANRARLQRLAFYSRAAPARHHRRTASWNTTAATATWCCCAASATASWCSRACEVLRDAGVTFREVDADEARKIEPALNPDTELAGAIHLPDDEVGNCRQFALLLKREAEALGAQFHFNCDIAPLDRAAPPRTLTLAGGSPPLRASTRWWSAPASTRRSCCGRWACTSRWRRCTAIRSARHIREPLNAPRSAVMDERYKVAISRLGMRVRVAGSAETRRRARRASSPAALQTLYKVLHDWFPGAAHACRPACRNGKARGPMLPDGPPVIGASGVPGVWLNLGHGSSGWALSCGSARVVADLMAGRDAGHRPRRAWASSACCRTEPTGVDMRHAAHHRRPPLAAVRRRRPRAASSRRPRRRCRRTR